MKNKGEQNNNTGAPQFLEGYGGAKCSPQDVMIATNAMNNLDEKNGGFANLLNGVRGDVNWACATENIKGPWKDQSPKTNETQTTPKATQQVTAQTIVTEKNQRDHAINGFKPNIPTTIPTAQNYSQTIPFRPHSYNYYNQPRAMFTPFDYTISARMQLIGANISFSDRMRIERAIDSAYGFMQCGMGYYSNLGSFSNTLSMTGLISSYNGYNIDSMVRDAIRSYGEIGGVATEVAVITDLINSEAHAKASEYFFCFPKTEFPFPDNLIKVIEKELAQAYFKHKTLPFFSLHFNNDGFLYPVIHPAFEGTLVGEIIALLDYWMKGFLNGGVFDTEFLKLWHEKANCDESYLRSKLVDLKKYCKENAKNVGYISLRELESRYGLKSKGSSNANYSQPFMTSFRIISHQAEISRHGNVLIPNPTFKVKYSIDLMPDYKDYLEKYHQEHGDYPEDYENTRRCYELFAEEIKTKMPQLPFFRDYFQLLGVINSFCYAYATFEKMGKEPVYSEAMEVKSFAVPKAFPPLPVRYFHSYPISMSVQQLLCAEILPEVTDSILKLFNDRSLRNLPENTLLSFKNEITKFIKRELTTHLSPNEVFESNEEEIDRIAHTAERFIYKQVIQTHAACTKSLQQMVKVLDDNEQKQLKLLPLPKKIIAVQNALDKQVSYYKEKWQAVDELQQEQILQAFTPELHKTVKGTLQKINENLAHELECLTYLYKKWANMEEANQLFKIPQALQEEVEQDLKETETELEAILASNIQLISTQIQSLQQHRASQLAQIPPHLHAINAANIAAFTTPLDGEITRLATAKTTAESTFMDTAKKEIAKQKIAAFEEASLKGGELAIKEEALRLLDFFHQLNTKKLTQFTKVVSQFALILLEEPELANIALTKHYTHAIMGFTSKDLAQKTGDNFQIVGGCGLAVPNLQTKAIEHGDDFCKALAQALSEQKEQTIHFSFNSQHYVAYSLTVTDVKNATKEPINKAQATFLSLIKNEITAESLTEDFYKESLDPSHANLLHYAATSLDATRFNQLKSDCLQTQDLLGNLPLHFAASSGNVEVVGAILSKNPSLVDAKNNRGLTPLILAIQNNHLEVVKQLIAFKADCNYRLPNGLFPLYIALQQNFEDIALFLIDTLPNLNLNETIDSKMTALHLAIEADSLTVGLKLIEKGANCNVTRKSDGFTPLFCSVKKGRVDLIKAMQIKGVSLKTLLDSGKSILHIAAENGQLECLRYLLDQGLEVDALTHDGQSALMLAIKAGFIETAQELASKAKLNLVNPQKQTASLLAIKYAMPTVSDTLIERGEDPELMDDKGYNYLYYLVRNGESLRFFALMDANKVTISQTYQGDTLIDVAAKYRQFLIAFPLIEKNLKSNPHLLEYAVIADEIGYVRRNAGTHSYKLLYLAAQHGSVHCLAWLLKNKEFAKNHLLESVKRAIEQSNNPKAVELLVQKIGDVNQTLDAEGNSALHLATACGQGLVVELLLSVGSDSQLRNKAGQTAFQIAVLQEDDWLLKRLLKHTKPSEWPGDLWQPSTIKPTTAIAKILATYRKRLPKETKTDFSHPVNQTKSVELSTLIMTESLTKGLQKLEDMFEEAIYEEVMDYLIENPELLVLFKAKQGAHLLKILFDNIHDHSKLLATIKNEESEELILALSPDNLLGFLKNKGVNPTLFTGEHNVILSLVRTKSDKDALHRLAVFARHFPESVASLAMDNFSKKIRVIELALKPNKVTLFKALIEHCTQHNRQAISSLHGLHEAVLSNNYEFVQSLLKDYPINSLNQKKQTPLMLAASLDNVRIMELLLAHGANPDLVDILGQNALHHALHHKALSAALCILPLLKQKNLQDRHGLSPLMLSAAKGILPVLRYLCEQGDFSESVDNKGWNALHFAAFEGQIESAIYLVSQGFAIDAQENPETPKKQEKCQKRTALHLSALKGHTDLVRQLIQLGAKMEQEDASHQSVFEYGVKSKKIDLLHFLQELPLYHSKERDTQLLLAATVVDNENVVSQLILDDVNCNATDESGCSALHLAAMTNSGKVASLILQGGDVALDMNDQRMCTPLHYAARYGHVWLIELLCGAGANINYYNNLTPTALFIACEQGKSGAVSALLKHKADSSIPNKDGLTPMKVAQLNGHQNIVQLLEQKPVADLLIRNGLYRQNVPKTTTTVTNSLSIGQ